MLPREIKYSDGGKIFTSNHGLWTSRSSGVTSRLNTVAHGNKEFVAVGDAGVVLMSEDRITWIQQSSPEVVTMHSITYEKNRFLAVGENGISFKIESISEISLTS
jgi:photosystem II stability/assembly factor-like uncharacterized protein